MGAPFTLPVGFAAAREALAQRFPSSAKALEAVLDRMEILRDGVADLNLGRRKRSLGATLRGAAELRSLVGDWRASLDDVLARTLAADEAAKFALAGNLAYFSDDPRKMWWPFFAIAQGGFLKSGGVYIKGGGRVLTMKLAKVVTREGGAVLLGRQATNIEMAGGRPALVSHVDPKHPGAAEKLAAPLVFANCSPHDLGAMLDPSMRASFDAAYGRRELSISLFSAYFGLNAPPSQFGLAEYGSIALPPWAKDLRDVSRSGALLADDPTGKLPIYGVANYGAIDSGLSENGPILVSVVGVDRLSNWTPLTEGQEAARRERWLDAFQAALDRDYPGFAGAVVERLFVNARAMRNFLHTPDGAVYGFAPKPPEKGIWAGIPRSPRTPAPGVYLASSFAGSGGFSGAMAAGAEAARLALADEDKGV